MIRKEHDVEVNPYDRVLTREELLQAVKGRDGILCLLTDKIDAEVFDAAGPQLKVVSNYAVGYDNIDVDEATKRGIVVTNTPGVLTETTADLAWALIMSVARRIVEADKFTRAGKYDGWAPMLFLGQDIYGKTLGIIGMGRIGQAVARRAKGFNMKVLYNDIRRIPEELEKELNATFASMDEVIENSDFISLHTYLSPETYHLINEEKLKRMKKTAYLINTSRGPVIDEAALVKALKEGWIAGAGLDVYEFEPKLVPGLAECENAVLLPHIASASVETRTKMATMAAENLLAVLAGRMPPNPVNPEVMKK
ncbi:MAG: D-glycerate dehydrogenase [Dictyoglomi bacterium]|nr:D-glycerate dehydrogenase [Dictyoglomota bacterium]HHV80820.1 D-glycerate dehydrogenase [bacterium]